MDIKEPKNTHSGAAAPHRLLAPPSRHWSKRRSGVVNPDWYWGTAAEWGGSEPLPRKQAPFVVETLPGGCLLYRLGVQSSLPQGRKPCGPRPDHKAPTANKRLSHHIAKLKLV